MRFASLTLLALLGAAACGSVPVPGTTDGGTDTETGTGTGSSSTTGTPVTSGPSACVPGVSVACACPNADMGAQVCNPAGTGYGPCECEGGGSNSASEAMPTTEPAGTTSGVGSTDPGTTTDVGTTTDAGTSTTAGTTTEAGSSSGSGTSTGGVVCDDPGPEPNEVETEEVDLGDQNCGAQAQTLEGVLDGDGDVDWFSYHGVWQFCAFGPNTAHALTASEDVRLCVFADCDMGNPQQFGCKDGVMLAQSPDGLPGCCNNGDVNFNLDCGFISDSARLYIRVDQAPPDTCVDYAVEYDFDE